MKNFLNGGITFIAAYCLAEAFFSIMDKWWIISRQDASLIFCGIVGLQIGLSNYYPQARKWLWKKLKRS